MKPIAVTARPSHFIILQKGVKHGVISLCRIDHEDVSWQEDVWGVRVSGCSFVQAAERPKQ